MEINKNINTYENIQLIGPYKLITLTEVKIEKKINDHGKIHFTGIISESDKEKYIEISNFKKEIEVNLIIENKVKEIFKGTVINVEIKMIRDIYYIVVEGISYSYEMDIALKNRSFQNIDMLYTQLIKKITSNYEGSDFIDMITNDNKIKAFKLQYKETDWNFLKRIASEFNVPLVVESIANKPKFWIGIPEGKNRGELDSFDYSIRKNISDFRNSSENYISEIEESDFIYYEIESDDYFNIGDSIIFKNRKLLVWNVITEMIDGILKYKYSLASENRIKENSIYNKKLVGVSIEGKVIDVSGDYVKIKLDIDSEQKKEEANWFHYSTFYSNIGWYCMPELEDNVMLYFPSDKEKEAVMINSIRKKDKGGDKIDDPNTKYLRTKDSKEVMFNKEEIVFTGKDDKVLIRINETSGIEMNSDSDIKINAHNGLNISAANIEINSQEQLNMTCRASCIKMDGNTDVKGIVVKIR